MFNLHRISRNFVDFFSIFGRRLHVFDCRELLCIRVCQHGIKVTGGGFLPEEFSEGIFNSRTHYTCLELYLIRYSDMHFRHCKTLEVNSSILSRTFITLGVNSCILSRTFKTLQGNSCIVLGTLKL